MIVERDVDCGLIYERLRRRLMATVRSLDDDALALTVPATPAWSVRDAVAHVIGVAHDLNAQRFDTTDPDAWTARQVRERRETAIDDLEVEWDHEAPRFEEGLRLLGYGVGSHFVGDLLQHVADIHHAVGLEPIGDAEALVVGLDFYLDSCHQALVAHDRGSLGVQATDQPRDRWTLGAGREVATLDATRYELFRALGGRRSRRQIRAMAWTGDVDAVAGVLTSYPPPIHDLIETSATA
ncbi:MAG TPA: maleylpyruvate isomerase N-terminal domain-containing protein [Acidimicrobiales bacterium]|nr:maleylpyruvate isomerase N-terminal domain-containing protein [Acidimicrobiales bacterium]